MSLFTDLYTEIAAPLLGDFLGDDVLRYPLGALDGDKAQTITNAIWNELEATQDQTRGREVIRNGVLVLPAGSSIDARDSYRINGEIWQVVTWQISPTGTIDATLKRTEREVTTSGTKQLI